MEEDDLLTVEDAAKALGMTPGGIRKAIQQKRLTPRRFSPRVMLIPRSELERYRQEHSGRGYPAGRPRATPRQEAE